jgi:hypothetical protein
MAPTHPVTRTPRAQHRQLTLAIRPQHAPQPVQAPRPEPTLRRPEVLRPPARRLLCAERTPLRDAPDRPRSERRRTCSIPRRRLRLRNSANKSAANCPLASAARTGTAPQLLRPGHSPSAPRGSRSVDGRSGCKTARALHWRHRSGGTLAFLRFPHHGGQLRSAASPTSPLGPAASNPRDGARNPGSTGYQWDSADRSACSACRTQVEPASRRSVKSWKQQTSAPQSKRCTSRVKVERRSGRPESRRRWRSAAPH